MKRLLMAGMAAILAACSPPAPKVTYAGGVFIAQGWAGGTPTDGWPPVFSVTAGSDPKAPAMLGSYVQTGSTLTFTPRFPPSPALDLHVRFDPGNGRPAITADFPGKAEALKPEATVAAIWPSADTWPANTLRMYVEFSAPMAIGEAWTHLRVRDADGKVIEKPFVEIEQEMWDPAGKRLTVLFDPGRIKRGLIDNEQSGPPLMPGRTVTIEVDPSWRDARGTPMAAGFSRTIKVGPEVRQVIDLSAWKVEAPTSPSSDLVVRFPRPLDHALALRAITVTRSGEQMKGGVSLEANDTVWRFHPSAPWTSGRYAVAVDGVLEDVAGNRMGRLFDVDTSDPRESTVATKHGELPFVVE